MARRTYRPHIRSQVGPRWNSLIGWIDFSAILKDTDWRRWECEGHGVRGEGSTQKEAYDRWYADFIRENQHNAIFMAAYRRAQTPQWEAA